MKIYVVGSINMDLVIHAPFMPENGVTISGSDFLTNPGGKGANQAVAASKMETPTYMIGGVGQAFGDELKNVLASYGVNTDHVKKFENASSGIAVIVVVDHDNRIILDAGANYLIDEELIDNGLKDAEKGDYLICQLEIPQRMVKYAFKKAKEKGMKTVLNPAPAAKLDKGILPLTDYFIPNQSECEFYTGIYPLDRESIKKAQAALLKEGVKNVVITLGLNGSCALVDGKTYQAQAYKVEAVDTTAAGDTYIGTFVSGLCMGKSVIDAMNFASIASALTVTKPGAQQSIPYLKDVLKIINK